MTEAAPRARGWRRVLHSPLTHLVLAFVVLGLIQAFVVKLYAVPSDSMAGTLRTGDRILVDRVTPAFTGLARGDVIVFDAGEDWGDAPHPGLFDSLRYAFGDLTGIGPASPHTLVKRIVAVPGDSVSCCDSAGRLIVDGEPLDEPYVLADREFVPGVLDCTTSPDSGRCFREYVVPADRYFVLGDNRVISVDSLGRCRDPGRAERIDECVALVARDDIVGRVFAIVFPFDRLGVAGAPSDGGMP